MSKLYRRIAVTAFFLLLATGVAAEIYAPEDLAIEGYDPVAYFTEEEAREGSPEHNYRWEGAEWRFVSAENRRRFIENPEAYAPAYGGWCAWAMADGYYADSDPTQWTIHEGRLFLNYSGFIKLRWLASKERRIDSADEYWRKETGN
jgi:YHS domain-containing protein